MHAGRLREAGRDLGRAARIVVLLVSPVSVSLFIVAGPVASVLFGYGAADPEQIAQLGIVTQIFALAIMPFTVYYVLLRGWYAQEDTRTPFYLALVLNTVNVGVALAAYQLVEPGAQQVYVLAFAFVVSYWAILLVAWPILARRYGGLDTVRTVVAFAKTFLASLVGLGAGLVVRRLTEYDSGGAKFEALLDMAVVSAVVLLAYVLAVWLLRIREGRELWRMVAGRLGR